jgi:hypothetical protein
VIVVDEYLAIRSLLGDVPGDLPDEPLAITASAHWRILQRIHAPSGGQLSQALSALSLLQAGPGSVSRRPPSSKCSIRVHFSTKRPRSRRPGCDEGNFDRRHGGCRSGTVRTRTIDLLRMAAAVKPRRSPPSATRIRLVRDR